MRFFHALLLLMSSAVLADSPPAYLPFESKSSNGLYIANVYPENGDTKINPWERRYRLRVSESTGNRRTLWEVAYPYDGYQEGQPSNDGQYFAYVNFWYSHDDPVVIIYTKTEFMTFKGKDLGINAETLRATASHKLWLNAGWHFSPDAGVPSTLIINTVQGPRRIELRSNPSLKRSTNSSRNQSRSR